MLEKGIYTKLKDTEWFEVKGTILEKSFEEIVDYLLESIISCYGLGKIRGKLDKTQTYYLEAILDDKEF